MGGAECVGKRITFSIFEFAVCASKDDYQEGSEAAFNAVDKEASTRGTAKAFGIAYSTLRDHVGKKTKNSK